MKKIMIQMNILMGVTLSFFLSLIGNLRAEKFSLPGFLISFLISVVISMIVGLLVPVKPLTDRLEEKCGIREALCRRRILRCADLRPDLHAGHHGRHDGLCLQAGDGARRFGSVRADAGVVGADQPRRRVCADSDLYAAVSLPWCSGTRASALMPGAAPGGTDPKARRSV